MTGRRVVVFGPAYLDRVLRVDRPLVAGEQAAPIDQSVEGDWKFGHDRAIEIVAPGGFRLDIRLPPDWPGPRGEIQLRSPIREGLTGRRSVRGIACQDDLGGMGAGYTAALGGVLHSALGSEADPTSRAISNLISRYRVAHRPIRVPDQTADWTLLITSGEYGDKLPIGFRGCHAALDPSELARRAEPPADLVVVAALPNQLVEGVLRSDGARTRFFAPAARNMADRQHPVARFADRIDILSCNRTEWEMLEGREAISAMVPIVAVTDGPRGSEIRFTSPRGAARRIQQPAFPRVRPPRDTNRAGEAFASTLVATLLDLGWTGAARVIEDDRIRSAAERAAAAAALVLDREDFGFPEGEQIDVALKTGRVE
jgi:sugar/nucleoside kinase (ribokinase family)